MTAVQTNPPVDHPTTDSTFHAGLTAVNFYERVYGPGAGEGEPVEPGPTWLGELRQMNTLRTFDLGVVQFRKRFGAPALPVPGEDVRTAELVGLVRTHLPTLCGAPTGLTKAGAAWVIDIANHPSADETVCRTAYDIINAGYIRGDALYHGFADYAETLLRDGQGTFEPYEGECTFEPGQQNPYVATPAGAGFGQNTAGVVAGPKLGAGRWDVGTATSRLTEILTSSFAADDIPTLIQNIHPMRAFQARLLRERIIQHVAVDTEHRAELEKLLPTLHSEVVEMFLGVAANFGMSTTQRAVDFMKSNPPDGRFDAVDKAVRLCLKALSALPYQDARDMILAAYPDSTARASDLRTRMRDAFAQDGSDWSSLDRLLPRNQLDVVEVFTRVAEDYRFGINDAQLDALEGRTQQPPTQNVGGQQQVEDDGGYWEINVPTSRAGFIYGNPLLSGII